MSNSWAIVSDGRLFTFHANEVGPLIYRRKDKKEGGPNLLRDRKMDFSSMQPDKCRGCVWGRWEGQQFCSLQKCVKEGDSVAPVKP